MWSQYFNATDRPSQTDNMLWQYRTLRCISVYKLTYAMQVLITVNDSVILYRKSYTVFHQGYFTVILSTYKVDYFPARE